jgi:hypothetical protein
VEVPTEIDDEALNRLFTLSDANVAEARQRPVLTPNGTVKLTLIMIYFANANTSCSGRTRRMVAHFAVALAK